MNRSRNPATNVKIKYGVFDIGKYEKTPSFDVNDIPFQGTSRLNPDQRQLLTTDSGVPKTSMDVFLARGDLIYMAGHIWFDTPLRKNIEMPFCLLRQQDHAWIYRAGLTCPAE